MSLRHSRSNKLFVQPAKTIATAQWRPLRSVHRKYPTQLGVPTPHISEIRNIVFSRHTTIHSPLCFLRGEQALFMHLTRRPRDVLLNRLCPGRDNLQDKLRALSVVWLPDLCPTNLVSDRRIRKHMTDLFFKNHCELLSYLGFSQPPFKPMLGLTYLWQ